jgi:hypothetical protein
VHRPRRLLAAPLIYSVRACTDRFTNTRGLSQVLDHRAQVQFSSALFRSFVRYGGAALPGALATMAPPGRGGLAVLFVKG